MIQTVILKINGMHCSSCSMNIDGELEDTDGVIKADTSYAKAQISVEFDESKISLEKIKGIIKTVGYTAEEKI
ncbi:MAG: heavy-metal-associated domain-containing protein [Candidatus Doudnabacteria bacterium]|nr:heavy-metal-associated domain-containing protein [Candidatus Doudnabacteria bacterium]